MNRNKLFRYNSSTHKELPSLIARISCRPRVNFLLNEYTVSRKCGRLLFERMRKKEGDQGKEAAIS